MGPIERDIFEKCLEKEGSDGWLLLALSSLSEKVSESIERQEERQTHWVNFSNKIDFSLNELTKNVDVLTKSVANLENRQVKNEKDIVEIKKDIHRIDNDRNKYHYIISGCIGSIVVLFINDSPQRVKLIIDLVLKKLF